MTEKTQFQPIEQLLHQVAELLKQRSLKICTAESCTGGQVAMWLTELAGSSAWFERGFVTYSNEAKISMLNVRPQLIDAVGAVSEPVAQAMARGALSHSRADIALAITGIAGPSGATQEKPIGMVCFAIASQGKTWVKTAYLNGTTRHEIRAQASLFALTLLTKFLDSC